MVAVTRGVTVKDASGWQPSDAGHTGRRSRSRTNSPPPGGRVGVPGWGVEPGGVEPVRPDATYSLALTSEAVESFTVTVDGRTATVPATGAGLTGRGRGRPLRRVP